MDIGVKLRQARLESGMSQRQLCGDVITRNMLSLIENGSARPSMDTLAYLAGQLGKPISYFLEETAAVSANTSCMERAREAYTAGNFAEAEEELRHYSGPDGIFDAEFGLLKALVLLSRAEQVLDRPALARELLEEAELAIGSTCYGTEELERRRLLLLTQVSQAPVNLPADDSALLYRAKLALQSGDAARCVALLEACEERESKNWRYWRAEAAFVLGDYALAAEYYPEDCYARLEACYRNLGDYKMAYEYACKQRENTTIFE